MFRDSQFSDWEDSYADSLGICCFDVSTEKSRQEQKTLEYEQHKVLCEMVTREERKSRVRVINGVEVETPDPDMIKNDGSLSCQQNLAEVTEPVPIVSVGIESRKNVDQLLNRLSQISGQTYNRKWLAGKLEKNIHDLNNSLKPDAPKNSFNGLARRSVQFLEREIKRCAK